MSTEISINITEGTVHQVVPNAANNLNFKI